MNEWIGGGGGKDVSFSDKLVKKEENLYSYISSINSSIKIYYMYDKTKLFKAYSLCVSIFKKLCKHQN